MRSGRVFTQCLYYTNSYNSQEKFPMRLNGRRASKGASGIHPAPRHRKSPRARFGHSLRISFQTPLPGGPNALTRLARTFQKGSSGPLCAKHTGQKLRFATSELLFGHTVPPIRRNDVPECVKLTLRLMAPRVRYIPFLGS